MACPFSRDLSKAASCGEQAARRDTDRSRIVRLGRGDSGRSRQSSFEVTSLLMREETEDAEDTQTLNLKHLRAAVLILTNPSGNRRDRRDVSRLLRRSSGVDGELVARPQKPFERNKVSRDRSQRNTSCRGRV
ncbi:hypothetical protein K0M31_010103 [Melipona bicolor]|uniref:Uncharacterized protein n=1 Tax=Melipona bicolor TaxID=60889 RepID=A0AA40FMX6_9HYME|nr:hypothetical protein K0M31_010103 [Melipona bicolor]